MKRSKTELCKRYAVLLAGLTIMAFGVALSIRAALGTSPISSLPYVTSLLLPLTVGEATIAMHCGFIALQILLLRKNYDPLQLMQLPVAVFFGYLTDIALRALTSLNCSTYGQQWLACAAGIALVAFGVSCEVDADVVMLAGEGLVLAICRVTGARFGSMKVGFDVALVVIASALSLGFLGRLEGVREGTLAAALCVGPMSRLWNRALMEKGCAVFFGAKDAEN